MLFKFHLGVGIIIFIDVPQLYFIDIDECETKCGENGNCTNTNGSYDCICDDGYKKIDNICEGKVFYFDAAYFHII